MCTIPVPSPLSVKVTNAGWFSRLKDKMSLVSRSVAEMLTSALATQCMIWDTSPAAAELEEQMMKWLKEMTGLPDDWSGVIHDGASTATLTAIITAREKLSSYNINKTGFSETDRFRIYCSTEAHSSVEKSVRIAGIGDQNLVKVNCDSSLALDPAALEKAIVSDIKAGYIPLCVVAAIGTTGTTAIDPLAPIGNICEKLKLKSVNPLWHRNTSFFIVL